MNTKNQKPEEGLAEKKGRILILMSREAGIRGFENYLKNRHWEILAITDVKKALVTVLSQKLDCVLVTVDHKNPKILKIPAIIAQTVKIPVFLFSEGNSQNGINYLRSSKHPYVLFPPVSGPSIERMMIKAEKDRLGALNEGSDKAPSDFRMQSGDGGSDTFTFRSSNFNVADVMKLFEGDGTLGGKTDEEGLKFSSGSGSVEGDLAGIGSAIQDSEETLRRKRSVEPKETSQTKVYVQESVLVRGAEHALAKSAKPSEFPTSYSQSVPSCTKVSCFEVLSTVFSGYLVVAFGADRAIDEAFNERLRQNLADYLESNGLQIADTEVLNLTLHEVGFEKWSLREAAFLRKSVHRESEIALAFFPRTDNDAPLELSGDNAMFKMKLSEIRQDTALEFDIYLHLPANQKYVRYVAKNRFMHDRQRSRLEIRDVKEVHVRKEAEKDIVRYRVQNFLNDKIKVFLESEAV